MRLVQDPVSASGMRYDDLALDKIWRVTAGHPYFLQLLCHSLVNQHNKAKRSYTTVADVNSALDEILASGEAHFIYLWTESTPEDTSGTRLHKPDDPTRRSRFDRADQRLPQRARCVDRAPSHP